MFVLKVNKSSIHILESEPIYGDSRNIYNVILLFNEDWNGLTKVITFDNGEQSKPILVSEPTRTIVTTSIPWELLTYPGTIRISVAGAKDNLIVLPTQFSVLGKIKKGSTVVYPPDGPKPEPTPSVVDRLLDMIAAKGDTLQYKDNILYLMSGDTILSEVEIQNGSSGSISEMKDVIIDNKSFFAEGTNQTYYFRNVSVPYSESVARESQYKVFTDDIVQVVSTVESLKIYNLNDEIFTFSYAEDGSVIFESVDDAVSGADGKSAYEIAVENGFVGTEEEWLESLKGEKGDPGADGVNGVTPEIGENGNWFIGETDTGVNATGSDGVTPSIGENGNWFIGDTDTGISANGTPGPKGDKGDKGDSGADGVTPHIGENGNWFIGETDTGVSAKGEKGDPGADGVSPYIGENGNWFIGETDTGISANGAPGPKGDKGDPGPKGDAGSDGVTPHIGDNGNWFIGETDTGISANGTPGPKGDKGDKGDPGADGVSPHIGENGNWFIGETDTGISAKGEKGDKGDKGDPGPQGPAGGGANLTAGDGIAIQEDTISVNTPVRDILTQAEFDALPAEQQGDGLYFIDNGESGGGSSMEVYDDQERVIGTWFGKPLYRKVVNGAASGVNAWTYLGSIQNFGQAVSVRGILQNAGENLQIPYQSVFTQITSDGKIGAYVTISQFQSAPIMLIAEYTKTTDQGVTT